MLIVVKGRISVKGIKIANGKNKKLNFKNNAPFRSCISKINNTFQDNEVNDDANENKDVDNYGINSIKTTTSKSFEYETKIIGSTPDTNSRLYAEVVVPLKCF